MYLRRYLENPSLPHLCLHKIWKTPITSCNYWFIQDSFTFKISNYTFPTKKWELCFRITLLVDLMSPFHEKKWWNERLLLHRWLLYIMISLHSYTVWGHSKTTLNKFWPILTTYLHNVDICWHLTNYQLDVNIDIQNTLTPIFLCRSFRWVFQNSDSVLNHFKNKYCLKSKLWPKFCTKINIKSLLTN